MRSHACALALLVGDGAGGFAGPFPIPGTSPSSHAILADIDGDGADDLVDVVNGGDVQILSSAGDGTFLPEPGRRGLSRSVATRDRTADVTGPRGRE